MKQYVRKSLKVLLWLLICIVGLVVLALIALQLPFVQNKAKDKVVVFLEDKIKTKISIGDLSLDFPKRLVLEDVYVEDQAGDTLLAGDTIKVDISLLKLLSNQIVIHEVDLRGITAFINTNIIDSTYNFDYIIKAFVREEERDTPLDSAAAMRFSVNKINLDRIRVHFDDQVTGTDMAIRLDHFDTRIAHFDLDNKKFRIPKITLNGLHASMLQTKALSTETITTDTTNLTPPRTYPDVELGEIEISDIHIDYDNTVTAIDSRLDLGSLLVEFDTLDLPNQMIDVRVINLKNTEGRFALGETAQKAVEATATEVAKVMEKGWRINLEKLGIDSIDFKYDDLAQKQRSRGIDYKHIDIKDLHADASGIFYNTDTLSGKINELTLTEHSGLAITNFTGDLYYGNYGAKLDNYVFETPRSHISDRIYLTYPSVDTISKNAGVVGISANFENSRIAVNDLLLFAPSLAARELFSRNPNAIILLDGGINGRINDIDISHLNISGLGNLKIIASGNIKGLPDINRSYFNLNINRLSANASDIVGLVPRGTIPASIRLPEYFELKGTFKGTTKSFTTNMNLNSTYGNAYVNGTLKNISSPTHASYDARIKTNQFNVGRLIRKEDKIGKVTLSADIKGSGTDPKSANATFDGDIQSFHYNGYTYQNISLNGLARNGDIEFDAKANDPNMRLDIHALANMNGQYPALDVDMDIDSVNLQALNLFEKDLRIHGKIKADLPTADPDYLNGTIEASDLIIALEGKRYVLDTISIVSVASEGIDSIQFNSEVLTFNAKGQYHLTKVFPALQGTINKYFNTNPGIDTTIQYPPQQIAFNARLIRSRLVQELMPDLESMDDADLSGNFDSSTGELKINGSVPAFQYKDYTVNNLNLDVNTDNNALNYAITLDQLNSTQFRVVNTSLSGKAQNNILDVNMLVKDIEEKDQYQVAGKFTSANKRIEFSLLPNGLLLNYEPWTVADNNAIQFGKDGLIVKNFLISNNAQSLTINSNPQLADSPINIQFKDFQIETLTRLVTKDSLYAGGRVNGLATVRDMKTNMVFTSDLTVDDFLFQGDTVGNVALKVNNEKLNTYAAEVKLTGYGNQVNIDGFYFASGDASHFDLNADIVTLNMKSIEGFTMGQLENTSGTLTGDLNIKGTFKEPAIRGDLKFNRVGFLVTKFNSYFRAEDESLSFTPQGVVLNNFTLLDSTGNEAVLDGTVFTTDFKDYRYDLRLHADDFQVLNSTKENNKLYYGQLFIDSRMHIHGGVDNPVVDGSIEVNDKTNLSVVIPQTDPGIIDREGIVEFIDMDTLKYTILASAQDSLTRSDWKGMDVAVNITIDRDAALSLIIDEANGDYLNVKGSANLTGGIDPSGKMTLSGMYELDQGAYSFSFNQLKREFNIRKGSTISWTGEPLMADVNVTAVYIAETAPLSLVQNQLGDAEQSVVNTYKQKLPFEILLTMQGKLMQPEITFDIDLPEKNYSVSSEVTSTVQTRLAQLRTEPSELNKQVFAVLLLNRFISEDPFQNDAGGGISSMARQSASKLLSEQLNNLVGGVIAGFDLNFDINSIEDYTSGELKNRTDLTVGVSKQLLDDRLKVSVGSNFELEGPQEANRKTTNIAGDVSAEYQISKDGRYLLRAYRKDEYIIVQGQVVETGIGFVFTADYEEFEDLFAKKTEEEKRLREEERAEKKAARNE